MQIQPVRPFHVSVARPKAEAPATGALLRRRLSRHEKPAGYTASGAAT